MKQKYWHALPFERVFGFVRSREGGLTEVTAQRRLSDGMNKIPEAGRSSGLLIFLSQFKGALTLVLIVAGCVAWILGETSDAIIIALTVFITVLFGFVQEYRAEQAFRLLRSMLHPTTRVLRGGMEKEVSLEDVVVGDVLILAAGARVPADARLFEVHDLEVVESALTGESEPRMKQVDTVDEDVAIGDRTNMVYQGTIIGAGKGKAVVVAVGDDTELAHIAQTLSDVEHAETPLQKNLRDFVRWLTVVIGVMILVLFVVASMKGVGLVLALETAIAVAVASIPEGLVISVTAMLALGSRQMLKNNVLIRNLLAVETLGAVTVICTDKTGTLTEGNMSVVEVFADDEVELARVLYFESEVRVNVRGKKFSKWELFGSPTGKALYSWAVKHVDVVNEKARLDRLDVLPFNSTNKYGASLYGDGQVYVAGAPEKIVVACKLPAAQKKLLLARVDAWAGEGKRVIGVASGVVSAKSFEDVDDVLGVGLKFAGFAVIADPMRKSVVKSIAQAQQAGVRVVMITGDNAKTALSIARAAGIKMDGEDVLEGSEIQSLTDRELKKKIQSVSVFARISPMDKLRIVHALQSQHEVVAMTGDGINDAAALKKSEIGVAVGSAHDIAKESSDMVILDNDFASIVRAIAGGRRIYANVQKVVTFLLYGSFTSAVTIIASLLFGLPLPFLPAQILWVNIIEDAMPGLAFVFEPAEGDQMKRGPREVGDAMLRPVSKAIIFGAGLTSSIILFLVFWMLLRAGHGVVYARTVAFVLLGVDTFFTAIALKSLSKPVWRINPFNNMVLVWSLLGSYALYFVALYVPFFRDLLQVEPLDLFGWGVVFSAGLVNLSLVEIIKIVYQKK